MILLLPADCIAGAATGETLLVHLPRLMGRIPAEMMYGRAEARTESTNDEILKSVSYQGCRYEFLSRFTRDFTQHKTRRKVVG